MTDALSVAVVGCGSIGSDHASIIAASPDMRLTALVGSAANAAMVKTRIAAEQEAGPPCEQPDHFETLDEALASAAIDVVAVCTPSGLHAVAAELALAARKHTVIEKPIDVTVASALQILRSSEEAFAEGVQTSVISQHRFDVGAVRARAALDAGALGRVSSVTASVPWWRSQAYYDSAGWRGTWELDGGGALMNQGVHTVDLLLWLLGEPIEVFAWTGRLAHDRIEVEDTAAATIRFASGALGTLHATTAAYPGSAANISVYGDAGSAVLNGDHLRLSTTRGEAEEGSIPTHDAKAARIEGLTHQYRDIVECIRTGAEPRVSVRDGVAALLLVTAIYESGRRGTPVRIADLLDSDSVAALSRPLSRTYLPAIGAEPWHR